MFNYEMYGYGSGVPGDPQINAIRAGKCQEQYHNWALNGGLLVRRELVRNGYELDTLINDPDENVRSDVMKNNSDYVECRAGLDMDLYSVGRALSPLVHVDIDALQRHITLVRSHLGNDACRYLAVKYRCLTEKPSAIERTMTQTQLFLTRSPFWAQEMTFSETWSVCKRLPEGRQHKRSYVDKIFEEMMGF